MRYGLIVLACCVAAPLYAADRPNVIFIAVDDLRPQLGCYGEDYMRTPRLDELAREGRLFLRHYVQAPTCGASRYCLLSGRRPRLFSHIGNDAIVKNISGRPEGTAPESWLHLFRRQGYRTVCIGKVSHYPDGRLFDKNSGTGGGRPELPHSWSELATPLGKWETGWNAFFGYADGSGRTPGVSPPTEAADVADDGYPDGLIAEQAVAKLQELKTRDEPFLLAVGFYKPHLPFNAPQKYWDLYDPEKIPASPSPEKPENIAPQSYHRSGEMFGNYRHPDNSRHDTQHHRRLRHAYCAAVSYADTQVGKVLDAVDDLGLRDNTIIVVWGDHGWHLGDHDIWGKHTLFERALRSALIIRLPQQPQPGVATAGIVETLDLYPTLVDLCGLNAPQNVELGGESLRSLLEDPQQAVKPAARSYWKGGASLRTARYRLTHYPKTKKTAAFTELYDHQNDPEETHNIAGEQPELVERLLEELQHSPKSSEE